MKKFILTESEKNEIKSLYRSKGLVLSEQEGEYEQDAPNWDSAKEWVSKQPKAYFAPVDGTDEYSYGKKIGASSYAEWSDGYLKNIIYNNGIAFQYSVSNYEQFNGSWEWNGVEVIFSWRTNDSSQKGEYEQDAPNWDKVKEWAMSKPGAEEGQRDGGINTMGKPFKGISYVSWTEANSKKDGDYVVLYNYGKGKEVKDGKLVRDDPESVLSGDWEWNGNEVIFSWRTNDDSDSSSSTTTDTSNCESLFAEAEKEKTYNPANLKAGKVVIGKGNQGALVKAMQCYLNQKNEELSLGLTPLKVDSIFGNKTKEMTIKFQEQFPNELKADGIIGKNTYAKFGIAE